MYSVFLPENVHCKETKKIVKPHPPPKKTPLKCNAIKCGKLKMVELNGVYVCVMKFLIHEIDW